MNNILFFPHAIIQHITEDIIRFECTCHDASLIVSGDEILVGTKQSRYRVIGFMFSEEKTLISARKVNA